MAASIWSVPQMEVLDFPLPTFVRVLPSPRPAPDLRPARMANRRRRRAHLRRAHRRRADAPTCACRRRCCASGAGPVTSRSTSRRAARRTLRPDRVRVPQQPDRSTCSPIRAREAVPARARSLPVQSRGAAYRHELMPRRRRAWSAWNYLAGARTRRRARPVAVTYWINKLQPLPFRRRCWSRSIHTSSPRQGTLSARIRLFSSHGQDRPPCTAQQHFARLAGQAPHLVRGRMAWATGFMRTGSRRRTSSRRESCRGESSSRAAA